jgi:hypothetical protein
MLWFSGPIANAIGESKEKKLIFLVYLFESDDDSTNLLWDDNKISKLCKENCISIKLKAQTQICQQFEQLYPVVNYPTTYFIGNNGKTILKIEKKDLNVDELSGLIEQAIEEHKKDVSPPVVVANNSNTAHSSSNEQQLTVEEKVAKAKEKLKIIKEKKRAEDEEKARLSEIERRKTGQDILKAKQDREEAEMKRLAMERKREKEADAEAKKKILEKIQKDR